MCMWIGGHQYRCSWRLGHLSATEGLVPRRELGSDCWELNSRRAIHSFLAAGLSLQPQSIFNRAEDIKINFLLAPLLAAMELQTSYYLNFSSFWNSQSQTPAAEDEGFVLVCTACSLWTRWKDCCLFLIPGHG